MENILDYPTKEGQKRNNSTLAYADCCVRLMDWNRPFEAMSNDDLDSLYAVALGRWAYHLTRQGYIDALNQYRQYRHRV
jgi:hypothetical protein